MSMEIMLISYLYNIITIFIQCKNALNSTFNLNSSAWVMYICVICTCKVQMGLQYNLTH